MNPITTEIKSDNSNATLTFIKKLIITCGFRLLSRIAIAKDSLRPIPAGTATASVDTNDERKYENTNSKFSKLKLLSAM